MPQLNFFQNINSPNFDIFTSVNHGSLSFFGFNLGDSISFNTLNLPVNINNDGVNTASSTYRIGLYSLNGSTLSLANSISGSSTFTDINNPVALYISMTATSATQNITPGTWYFGILVSTGGHSDGYIFGHDLINPGNAFPAGFIAGRMTASTTAMPGSIATSDLDITGSDAMQYPYILLTA